MASTPPIVPVAREFTVTFRFCGRDNGKFPDPVPANPDITVLCNDVSFDEGIEDAEVSAKGSPIKLHRTVKAGNRVTISRNFQIPDALYDQYVTNGELVRVTITANNNLDGGGANFTQVIKGKVSSFSNDYLGQPGTQSITIEAYGEPYTITQTGL